MWREIQRHRSLRRVGCCGDTSSDDDVHNTSNSLLLLCADAIIAPVLLSGLSDVDELMVALGCRFALDVFAVAQQDAPLLNLIRCLTLLVVLSGSEPALPLVSQPSAQVDVHG